MLNLTFQFDSTPLDRAVAAFQDSLADFSPALRQIADDFREMIAEQFASEGRAGGTPWAELAPSTLRRKRGISSSILSGTGSLQRSLQDQGAPGHVEEWDGAALTLGSSLPYALYHQTGTGWGFGRTQSPGTPQKGRGMPARPIIVVSRERSEVWTGIVAQRLEEKTLVLTTKELG